MTKAKERKEQARRRGLRYVGDGGQHLTGVPAQDLSPEDVGRLTTKQIEAVLARTDLYHLMPETADPSEEEE